MSENEPRPSTLPDVSAAVGQIAALESEQKTQERMRLENQLQEHESAASNIRAQLGRDPVGAAVSNVDEKIRVQAEERARRCNKENEEAKEEALSLLEGIDIPVGVPVTVRRKDDHTHDFGGYFTEVTYVVQKTEGLVIIEKTSEDDRGRGGPETTQYIAGKELSMPLKIDSPDSELLTGKLSVEDAKEYNWVGIGIIAKEVCEELATERLIQDVLAVVEGQEYSAGRDSGESLKAVQVQVADGQSMKVYAKYYHMGPDIRDLAEVAVVEYFNDEVVTSYKIRVDQKVFDSYIKDDFSYPRDVKERFTRNFNTARAILERAGK